MKCLPFFVLLLLTACAHEERLSDQPEQAKAQLERWVPLGTKQADAQRIMHEHHFTCYQTNANSLQFDYRLPNNHLTPTVYEIWMVTLALDHEKVSDVSVKTGLKGL